MKTLINSITGYEFCDGNILITKNNDISIIMINYNEQNDEYECLEIAEEIKFLNKKNNEEEIYYPYLCSKNNIKNIFIYACSNNKKYFVSNNKNEIGQDITNKLEMLNFNEYVRRLENGYFLLFLEHK